VSRQETTNPTPTLVCIDGLTAQSETYM